MKQQKHTTMFIGDSVKYRGICIDMPRRIHFDDIKKQKVKTVFKRFGEKAIQTFLPSSIFKGSIGEYKISPFFFTTHV
jgi:hypothetical protein